MKIEVDRVDNGLKFKFNKKSYNLTYPKAVWGDYPNKDMLIDNLAHLLTINTPLIARLKNLEYNTNRPLFKQIFDKIIMNNIPNAVEDYEDNTEEVMDRFLKINYLFKKGIKIPKYKNRLDEGAIIPLSLGKDSLTTFAVLTEIGYPCKGVYVNDTISPPENRLKIEFIKELKKKFDISIVKNEVEKLNDFDFWEQDETCLGYTHMTTGFCLISLPFLHHHKFNSIILGNQQDMNFSFINKDGFKAYPAYDQTKEAMGLQNEIIGGMTNNQAKVFSVIEPLTNIALMKILHNRYKGISKYQVSCDSLDASNETRWCHDCSKCARLYLMMRATDGDVKSVGFKDDLFKRQYRKHFALFNNIKNGYIDCYEKSKEARDQQLLAFYLAHKKGVKGYLIDLFKKNYLDEAKEKEEDLFDTFFNIYPSGIPNGIKSEVKSIYKEELQEV